MGGENARTVHGPARVHHARGPGLLQAAQAVGGAEQVAAGQQRQGQARLQAGQGLPVRRAAEALASRARMQGQPASAQVLQAQGQIGQHRARVVQAQAQLEAHPARPRFFQHGSGHGQAVFQVAQHGGARALAQDLGYGAAHVQVKPAVARLAQQGHGPA